MKELAVQEIERAMDGKYKPNLLDGLRWEKLGLGRVKFINGRATWWPATPPFKEGMPF